MTNNLTQRETYVATMMDIAEDFPDGAFLGFMEEKGISIDEVVTVSHKRFPDKREAPDDR